MASVKKFTRGEVRNQIRHIERTIKNPSNQDIDKSKLEDDYLLSPIREIDNYSYYLQRLGQLNCYNRPDVKTLAGWIITAPKDLPVIDTDSFFRAVYSFLIKRYGKNNCISCAVHKDESGQPHLHFLFIPACIDKKKGGEKVCANEVLSPAELRNFHPALQKHLSDLGYEVKIMTGITKRQGGNKSVASLKEARQTSRWHTPQYDRWR